MPVTPIRLVHCGLNTHANAITTNTLSTRFSGERQLPKLGTSKLGSCPRPLVNQNAIKGIARSTIGIPVFIQSIKSICVPVNSSYTLIKIMLGGVPIGVPTPPRLAAYAMPNSKTMAKRGCWKRCTSAKPIGININVVAVLEIHMLKIAAVSIKANTNRLAL